MALINKTRLVIIALIAFILGILALAWQYFFGGKAKPLEEGQFVVSPNFPKIKGIEKEVIEEKKIEKEYLAIVKNSSLVEGVREVIAQTGNFDFIQAGQVVLIKPNLNTGLPPPASTSPEVVREVIKLVKEQKPSRIIVADRSYQGLSLTPLTIKNMKQSGIYDVAVEEGVEIMGLEEGEWVRVRPKGAVNWQNGFRIPKILFEVDHIISLPVLKTHVSADFTMALKNSVGLVSPKDMAELHASSSKKFMAMLAEINLAFRPSLFIMDGTKAFISGGPNTGEVAFPQTYLASSDPVVLDAAGLMIINQYGARLREKDPWKQEQIIRAMELGLNEKGKEEMDKIITAKISGL